MIVLAAATALAEGLAVGGGLAALVVVLAIGVRLGAVTGTLHWARTQQWALALGATAAAAYEVWPYSLHGGAVTAVMLGLGMGLFVGMVAAAVAESVAALPLAARRLGLAGYLPRFVVAVALGKAGGALLWLAVPGLHARPPL